MRGSRIPVDPDFERLMRRPVGGPRTERVPPVVIGAVGRILGALGGIFWPSPLGSGEPTPDEIREMERRARPTPNPLTAPAPPPPPDTRGRELGELDVPELPRRTPLPLPLPAPGPVGPPTPAPTTPRSQTTTPARPSTQGIGAPEVFEPFLDLTRLLRSRPRRSSPPSRAFRPGTLTTPGPGTVPFAPPLPPAPSSPALPSPLTPFETTVLPSPRTAPGRAVPPNDPCRCSTTRKPRRKCLERAPVEFSAGRYKGRPAGTRCVRFQT